MNLRHKRYNSHHHVMQPNFQPVIGVLNTMARLNCNIKPQNHHFNIDFINPLKIIDKIILGFKKSAFDRIVSATFDIRIEEKSKFLPEALLNGDYQVIHEYKKMIERSQIGSYIKLNIKHQEKSYQKKKPVSLDVKAKQQRQKQSSQQFLEKVLNKSQMNQKSNSTEKFKHYLTVNSTKIHQQSTQTSPFTPIKQNRSLTTSRVSQINNNKYNESNFNTHLNIEEHRETKIVNHTHVHNVKKSSSIAKKSSPIVDGIKINYIAIKGSHQNPQTSTFIYKSTLSRTNRQHSEFGARTQLLSPHVIHFDKTLDNDISFSVHNQDKFSVRSQFKEGDDNLSEQFQKSVKNSEISQMTHNQMYTNDYFVNQRKILKKGRKSVIVENFQRREFM